MTTTTTKKKKTSSSSGGAKVVSIQSKTVPNAHKTVLPTTVIYGTVPKKKTTTTAPAGSADSSNALLWVLVGGVAFLLLGKRR